MSPQVWNKFLEFETNIGDLASVVKVERRRAAILEEAGLAGGENKHTIQVHRLHIAHTANCTLYTTHTTHFTLYTLRTRPTTHYILHTAGYRPLQVHVPAAPDSLRVAEYRLLLPLAAHLPPLLPSQAPGTHQTSLPSLPALQAAAAATNGTSNTGAGGGGEQGGSRPDTSQMVSKGLLSPAFCQPPYPGALQAQGELAAWRVHAARRRLPPPSSSTGTLPGRGRSSSWRTAGHH